MILTCNSSLYRFALCLSLLGSTLALRPTAAAPTTPIPGTVFESEADPAFVLRVSFALRQAAGVSRLHIGGGYKQRGYRLDIGAKEVSLVETGAADKRVAAASVRYAAQNSLLVTRREKLLRVALNGRILFESAQAMPAPESVTLSDPAKRLTLAPAPRYQPTEEIYLTDDFMVAGSEQSHWQTVAGTWHVAGVANPQGAADPFKFTGYAPGGVAAGISINRDSRWFWSDYQVSVASRMLDAKASTGIIFAYEGPQDYSGLTWSGPQAADGGKLRLWRRRGGQTVTLAERAANAITGQFYRLAVVTQGKRIAAYVDENPVLQAEDAMLSGGQCGLFAAGEGGAEFDDVRVQSVESTSLAAATRPDSGESWQTRRFATDPFMAAWGDAGADWEPVTPTGAEAGQNWYRHRSHYFDPLDITVALPALSVANNATALQELTAFGDGTANSGYRVELENNKITLLKGTRSLASAAGKPKEQLRLVIAGGKLTVIADERQVLQFTDTTPLRRGRVALRLSGPALPTANEERNAAAKVISGNIAKGVRLESQAVKEYRFDSAPVDWKIESGTWQSTTRWACVPEWSFFGGWGEPVATIWNKRRFGGDIWIDAFIAPREGTSDRMHFSAPVNINITFGAEGEKRDSGYTLVFRSHDQSSLLYRKGKVVAEQKDLVLTDWRNNEMFVYYRLSQTWQHLQILKVGGFIQVWVEIPAQNYEPLKHRLLLQYTDPEPLPGDRLALWTWGRNGMSVARVHVAAAQVGAPVADFLEPQTAPVPTTDILAIKADRRVNAINGGAFRTDIITKPIQPGEMPIVSLDYRHSPNTALALYAVAGGQRFRADFIGKVTQDGDSVAMGGFTTEKLDQSMAQQGWKRARFPLRQALRQFFPTGEMPRIEELYVANLSTRPEHVGGLEANAKGAVFEWRRSVRGVGIARDGASPDKAVQPSLTTGVVKLKVDTESTDPHDWSVSVNKRAIPWGSAGLTWHSATGEIHIDLAAAGFTFAHGEDVRLALTAPYVGSDPVLLDWTYRMPEDKTPPTAPLVATLQGPDRVDTFETSLGSWRRIGGEQGATLWRDTTTAASGNSSLRLFHRDLTGSFGALVTDKPFDARRWPMITFDYRLKPEVQLSLICEIDGKWFEFRFSDSNRTFRTVGTIQNVLRDGQWHQATVDLLGAVRRSGTNVNTISRLFFADTGYMNNVQDAFWNIDNFRFVPALPAGQAGAINWQANDLSGIAGYSWSFDNAAETVPDEAPEDDPPGATPPANTTYLHVRAKDRAGNWGPATHFRFAVMAADNLPTAALRPSVKAAPETGKEIAAPLAEVQLNAANLIDAETLRWKVTAGETKKEYDLSGANLKFDAVNGVLRWSDSTLSSRDGKPRPLSVELTASDLTGKEVLRQQWQWIVNPKLDSTAPTAPFLSYVPTNRLARFDFEDGMPKDVQLRRSAWVLHDEEGGSTGKASARIVNLNRSEFFSTFLKKTPYSVSSHPQVSFDYRFEPGSYNLNLVAAVNGDLQTVKMTDSEDAYYAFTQSKVGKLENFRTDGQWHNATFDFGAMLRKRYPTAPRFLAEYMGTWATGSGGYENPQGASMWLDNITFFSTVATSAGFEWQVPADDNGIRGYSYVLDDKPETMPGETITTDSTKCELKDLKPGKWFFHVRACDGAGNWGPASHVGFELTR